MSEVNGLQSSIEESLDFSIIGNSETNNDYWLMLLEIASSFDEDLVLGRHDPDSDQSPDIDVCMSEKMIKDVLIHHLRINPSRKVVNILPGVTNGTYYNDNKLTSRQKLKDGDKIRIGSVEILIRFLSNERMQGKSAQLITLKGIDTSIEKIPNIKDLVKPIFVRELQSECPVWMYSRAAYLAKSLALTLKTALQVICEVEGVDIEGYPITSSKTLADTQKH